MSYRSSYTPWKTSLSPGYKTSASNSYSSRDDVSSTSRYSSLASPSSYRPSFSGGTYRLKRDTPIAPASTYVGRYSAGSATSAVSKPDISINDSSGSKTGQLKRYGSTASNLGKYSREPSPAALEHTNRIKSRDPSPATKNLRGKSRDPSPALDIIGKNSYGSSANSYRLNVPKATAGQAYGTRYGSSATANTTTSNTSSASISYLSASDFRARSISKAREAMAVKSNEKELEVQEAEDQVKKEDTGQEASNDERSTDSSEEEEEEEEEKFISVLVCTRATSPTPPGAATATTVHRTRRMEIAKTIEKTIQRSTKKKKSSEKEIQSDRLDDSTRYSRFGLSSRVSSSYTPHTERYTSTSLRYSHSPLSTTSKSSSLASTSENKKDDVSASSTTTTTTSNKSNKSPVNTKLKLSPPKSFKMNSRQSSVENLSAQKPPAAPKGESPTKSISSSASLSKLPNKDFRKSALNVGPTDRPRKSRTPSTGTDSDLNTVEALNGAIQAIQRLERSPSAGSEVSNASNRSIRRPVTESKLRPKCHNKILVNGSVLSPKSPLSRNNSTINIKIKSSSSTSTPTTTQSSDGSTTGSANNTTTSSSSGTESCTDNKKSSKKVVKKKITKDVTSTTTSNTSTTTSTPSDSSANTHDTKSSIENSFSQQPPAVSISKSKKSDSSTTRTTPKTPSDKDPLRRLKKLSSVSNFFAAQQQENTNSDEQIYLESSERSSSGLDRSLSKKSAASITQANETKTTPSPAAKTTNYGCSNQSAINSIDEPKETISTKSSKSNTSSKTKSKPKTKSKINTNSSTASSSYSPQDTATINESSRMPSGLQTESLPLYTTTNPTTSSTSGTDQEESSWWQDTSRQIDTASALDFNLKDEVRFKIRHIDSGETAWWLRNDEDDTLADDLKTLNQDEELENEDGEDDEATDQLKSLTSSASGNAAKLNDKIGWWANETNDSNQNDDEVNNETNYRKCRSSDGLDSTSNNYCVEEAAVEAKPFPKSRLTPETDWWIEENEVENEIENDLSNYKNPTDSSDKSDKNISELISDKSPKQNGSIKLKICRVESGEKAWWLQDNNCEQLPNQNDLTVEATIALPKKTRDKPNSSSSSSESKNWWLSGPTKKLFNIQRIESGEKAWWQNETTNESLEAKDNKSKGYRNNNSQEQEWWLNETNEQQNQQPIQAHAQNGGGETQQHFLSKTDDEPELQQYNQASYNQSNLADSHAEISNSFNFDYSERPPPLGQCASPVQQEELLPTPIQQQQHQRQHSQSPYDNIPMTKVQTATQQPILETSNNFLIGPNYQQDVYRNQSPLQQQQQKYFPHQRQQQQQQIYLQPLLPNTQYNNNNLLSRTGQLFISRHQNIDELLGGSCRPVSPLFYDGGSFQAVSPQQRNIFVEEITPDQVRIHDSTAQMPIIQRMERDDWQQDSLAAKPTTPPRFEQGMKTNFFLKSLL